MIDNQQPARFPVLTVNISAITLPQAGSIIQQWITQCRRTYINVCTTHTILECYDAPALRDLVNHSGLATPDGMPLVWLGRLHKHTVGRVYGPDLMLLVCEQGQKLGWRHFFYGGAEGVPELLADKLTARFPELQIAGCYSPPFRNLTVEEEQEIAQMINASKADIVWVGLGTPRQDYWVARFRPLLDAALLIAVGAAFDFHSGRVKQAPRWMQRTGLEWFFRLSQDPQRLWKRYLLGNPRFVYLVLRHWFGGDSSRA
jgi:N-acetylglucosaminyldiphosphoundecaprenol N-acetyl-beta-D-mannosaminyltransferase